MTEKITLTQFSEQGEAAEGEGATESVEAEQTAQAGNAVPEPPEEPSDEQADAALPETDSGDRVKDLLEKAKQALLTAKKESIKKAWSADAEKLREIYPSFDMSRELRENEQLGSLLRAGVPLRSAYEVSHLEDILGTAMRYAAQKASEKTANSFLSGSSRPAENGIMNNSPSVTKTDVRSLTEKDILKILDRVSKGETVSF